MNNPYEAIKELAILTALRAAMLVLALAGRELPLSGEERAALIERARAALLGPAAAA